MHRSLRTIWIYAGRQFRRHRTGSTDRSLRLQLLIASSCIGLALTISVSTTAIANDIDLDFNFLRFGLPYKTVVRMLGEPATETISLTFALKHRRLMWVDTEGQKFVASFVQDRLLRWKKCSAGVADC